MLLAGELDLAVHSSKDVATTLPDGLHLTAFLPREDVRDVFISRSGLNLGELPPGATIGTSSVRRAALVRMHRPDLVVVPFRGAVNTRLRKIERGEVDGTLLTAAGLNRLGLNHVITQTLSTRDFLPSPAQGAICIQAAISNARISQVTSALNDPAASDAVMCERALLRLLDGSCRTPIGAHAHCHGSEIVIRGMI